MNIFEERQVSEIAEVASKANSKKEAAREAVSLTVKAIADDILTESLKDTLIEQAKQIAEDSRRFASMKEQWDRDLQRSQREIQRLQLLLSNVAAYKDHQLEGRAQDALSLFSSIVDAATQNFKQSNLDARVQVEIMKAASYSTWAYLGEKGKPSSIDLAEETPQ